jgi:hypothetical protein
MRRIIDGKRYDTSTATEICDCSPRGFYRNDFRFEDTQLYRTPRGSWFLAGEGGPMSRWARPVGLSGHTNGCGIQPLDADEARSMLERYGSAEDVEKYFGSQIVDA